MSLILWTLALRAHFRGNPYIWEDFVLQADFNPSREVTERSATGPIDVQNEKRPSPEEPIPPSPTFFRGRMILPKIGPTNIPPRPRPLEATNAQVPRVAGYQRNDSQV